MRQDKREEVIKQFSSAPKKVVAVAPVKGKKAVEEKPAPMVMLLSLKVRSFRSLLSLYDLLIPSAACRPELSDST
jgi:hypothetical protein